MVNESREHGTKPVGSRQEIHRLARGSHFEQEGEMCLMEAVSWVAGEEFSDSPDCVSPVLSAFGRTFNDALDDERRQRLVPLIPRLLNTAGSFGTDQKRGIFITNWLMHTYMPFCLRMAGLMEEADGIEGWPVLESWTDLSDMSLHIGLVNDITWALIRECYPNILNVGRHSITTSLYISVIGSAATESAKSVCKESSLDAILSLAGKISQIASQHNNNSTELREMMFDLFDQIIAA